MTDRVTIPTEFWQGMTREEFHEFSKTGVLNEDQCARVWQIGKFEGEPPEAMEIQLRRDDVMKLKTKFELKHRKRQ